MIFICKTCNEPKQQTKLNFSIYKGVWKGKQHSYFKIHCRLCCNAKMKDRQREYYRSKKALEILSRVKSFVHMSSEPRQYYESEDEMIWIKPWKIDLKGEELEIYNSL